MITVVYLVDFRPRLFRPTQSRQRDPPSATLHTRTGSDGKGRQRGNDRGVRGEEGRNDG